MVVSLIIHKIKHSVAAHNNYSLNSVINYELQFEWINDESWKPKLAGQWLIMLNEIACDPAVKMR